MCLCVHVCMYASVKRQKAHQIYIYIYKWNGFCLVEKDQKHRTIHKQIRWKRKSFTFIKCDEWTCCYRASAFYSLNEFHFILSFFATTSGPFRGSLSHTPIKMTLRWMYSVVSPLEHRSNRMVESQNVLIKRIKYSLDSLGHKLITHCSVSWQSGQRRSRAGHTEKRYWQHQQIDKDKRENESEKPNSWTGTTSERLKHRCIWANANEQNRTRERKKENKNKKKTSEMVEQTPTAMHI